MQPDPEHPTLTKRQVQIFALLADGYNSNDIAEMLGITQVTVCQIIARACGHLGASTDIQGVLLAYKMGLIPATRETASTNPT
jgi:DNA-binding NarL/FixJ family response regulator